MGQTPYDRTYSLTNWAPTLLLLPWNLPPVGNRPWHHNQRRNSHSNPQSRPWYNCQPPHHPRRRTCQRPRISPILHEFHPHILPLKAQGGYLNARLPGLLFRVCSPKALFGLPVLDGDVAATRGPCFFPHPLGWQLPLKCLSAAGDDWRMLGFARWGIWRGRAFDWLGEEIQTGLGGRIEDLSGEEDGGV